MKIIDWWRILLNYGPFLNNEYLIEAGNNDLLRLVVDPHLRYLLRQFDIINPVAVGNTVNLDGIGFSGYD